MTYWSYTIWHVEHFEKTFHETQTGSTITKKNVKQTRVCKKKQLFAVLTKHLNQTIFSSLHIVLISAPSHLGFFSHGQRR